MAIDANVLINERIKEELIAGKSVKLAIADGYKNALSAILDSNITTLLTAIILGYFGKGPIYGFAITLGIGILTTLFTSILVTRLIFEAFLSKNRKITLGTQFSLKAFRNLNFGFLSKRFATYAVSGSLVLIFIVSIFTR